jgi:D-beta-D-heptose 7-phosphate kinase/D-beta-D-heptose 1-phosphate adenosyltransferase
MRNKISKNKKIVVAVSGGFDPVHVGHVRLFQEAKKLGDELVVILNNDNWLRKKKGHVFMPQNERKEVIEAIRGVDRVVLTGHKPNPRDMSVCAELKKIRPDIFAQGGDRHSGNIPPCEVRLQKEIGFKIVNNVGKGGKVQSSSWLLANYLKRNLQPFRGRK